MSTKIQQSFPRSPSPFARMDGALLWRNPSPSLVHRKNITPTTIQKVLRTTSHPLEQAAKRFMEKRFDRDFSNVRVHTDTEATQSARSLDAQAYTVGRHIVFDSRHYTPGTAHGRRLLAHELAHTIQQGETSVLPREHLQIGSPTSAAEQEAESTARQVVNDTPPRRSFAHTGAAIQRQAAAGKTEKKAEKTEAGEVILKGLKTVAKQAKDNNPKVKKLVIDPLKTQLKNKWNQLGTGDKAVAIGFGAGTVGMTAGALLSDPKGRKLLEGVNLA
ncbi:MAG TPA: DUF4157 domain-containing protein, partial [Gammaproteobacteria bacterium]|nr:DUF4157 domain-containing protein [Gammaproteobacteria bacterium]